MASLEKQLRREIRHEAELRKVENRGFRRALKLQAAEYERRLHALNGENARILDVQSHSVTAEKFEDYKSTQETALKIALDAKDTRIAGLERWQSRATGVGIVVVLLSGVVGAALAKALGG